MIINIVFGILVLWLLIITWFVISIKNHYYRLITRTNKNKIDDILDKILSNEDKVNKDLINIKKQLNIEIIKSQNYFQKIGLIRFDPFERNAGEQSFVIALLNNENSGILINYINTRDGLRVYSKRVKNGKSIEYELSEEEKKAIEKSVN